MEPPLSVRELRHVLNDERARTIVRPKHLQNRGPVWHGDGGGAVLKARLRDEVRGSHVQVCPRGLLLLPYKGRRADHSATREDCGEAANAQTRAQRARIRGERNAEEGGRTAAVQKQ